MADTLSALTLVAQGCIPEYAQEAAKQSIEIAKLEASIDHHKLDFKKLTWQLSTQKANYDTDMQYSQECIDALEQEQNDNIQLIDHLRDKKRLLKKKYMDLLDETDKQCHYIRFIQHTTPHNTEAHDRRAFIQSNFKAPAATSIEIS